MCVVHTYCVCMLCVRALMCSRRPEEGVGSPGAGVTVGHELPNVGAGNWTQVLWKWNKYICILCWCVHAGVSLLVLLQHMSGGRKTTFGSQFSLLISLRQGLSGYFYHYTMYSSYPLADSPICTAYALGVLDASPLETELRSSRLHSRCFCLVRHLSGPLSIHSWYNLLVR